MTDRGPTIDSFAPILESEGGPIYLGDAVYARFDDMGGLVLTTENGVEVTNRVVLDPLVLTTLVAYLKLNGKA